MSTRTDTLFPDTQHFRSGHITNHEVGSIRIFDLETRFEIPSAIAGKFVAALKRTGESDDGVAIEPLPQGAGLPPRQHRPKPGPDRFRPTGRPGGKPGGRPAARR